MKRPLDEATEPFRENEARAGEGREKANIFRGLSLLAEGLRRPERELEEVDGKFRVVLPIFINHGVCVHSAN